MSDAKKILIIDDDKEFRLLLKDLLESNGYQVSMAKDGLEGMEKLKNEDSDLMLIEIRLPFVSGIGLVKIAKQFKPGIPIICLTSQGTSPENIMQEECVDCIFRKPFKINDLLDSIQKLLSA